MQACKPKPNYDLLDWPGTRKELKLTRAQEAAVVAAWKQADEKIAAEKVALTPLQRELKRSRYASPLLAQVLTPLQEKRLVGLTLLRQGTKALWYLRGLGILTLTESQRLKLHQVWARLDAEDEKQPLGSQVLKLEAQKWSAAGAILTFSQRQQLVALFGENLF